MLSKTGFSDGARARVPPEILLPGSMGEPVPPTRLMKIVCNAALAETTGGLCILLPLPAGMDHLTAVMCALACLPKDSAESTTEQIAKTFKDGQKVRVLPDGFVYKVAGGVKIGSEQGYWLQYLDAKKGSGNGRFAIWGDNLRRLEPTERSRPLGPDRKLWSKPLPTSIDQLCGANTLGNHALLTNRVTLLGSRSDLEAFLEETRLLPQSEYPPADFPALGRDFPWGSISEDGIAYIEFPRSTPGEPLIAATRNFAAARKASELASPASKLFVSRWLEGALQNFETLSRIADRQRVILLVDASARDRVGLFKKEGWTVWELSPDELLDDPVRSTGIQSLDRNARAAERSRRLKLECETATNAELSGCHESLRSLGEAIANVDAEETEILDDRVEDLLSKLWSLFLDAAGWLVAPDAEQHRTFVGKLGDTSDAVAMLRAFSTAEILNPIRDAVDALVAFAALHKPGTTTPKGLALLGTIESRKPDTIVFGSIQERDHAKLALDGLIEPERIVSVAEVREHGAGEILVACSMMARKSFSRFFDPCPAETVTLVGYDFEQEIYDRRLKLRRSLQARLSPDRGTKERLTGLPTNEPEGVAQPVAPAPPRELEGIERVAAASRKPRYDLPHADRSESDQTREGRLCRFAGCSWAVFTPNHSLSVLSHEGSAALSRKTVDDLQSGDRILLREAGDKDVIRLIAEDIAGPGRYAELWDKCDRWKSALRAISANPFTLWQKLSWFGLHRDPVTIRYWLLDEGVIGPRLRDDISIIVEAAGERPDDKKWDECWDAIVRLRGLHMQAGMRLTHALEEECRDLLFVDFEHEQAVELSLGLLWLVKVEEIQGLAHWNANIVNHLHWGREDWREEMLQNAILSEGV